MVTITLIGEKLAKEGNVFYYMGPLTECRECRLKTVCFSLEEGRLYAISSVRQVHHDCKVHEEGVRIVEVEKQPIRASVPMRAALEGHTISYEDKACLNIGCPKYAVCMPKGTKPNLKYRILKVVGNVDCPDGQYLKEVFLEI
jgi:hypothetical protein